MTKDGFAPHAGEPILREVKLGFLLRSASLWIAVFIMAFIVWAWWRSVQGAVGFQLSTVRVTNHASVLEIHDFSEAPPAWYMWRSGQTVSSYSSDPNFARESRRRDELKKTMRFPRLHGPHDFSEESFNKLKEARKRMDELFWSGYWDAIQRKISESRGAARWDGRPLKGWYWQIPHWVLLAAVAAACTGRLTWKLWRRRKAETPSPTPNPES